MILNDKHSLVIEDLIEKLEEEFDDLEPGKIKPETIFGSAIDWNSINSLVIITMIEYEYGVMLNIDEFDPNQSVLEVFELIKSKMEA